MAWLPTTGDVWSDETHSYYDSSHGVRIGPVPASRVFGPSIEYFALVPDFTSQPTEQQTDDDAGFNFTLRDLVEGQTWGLDRIVGRIFARCGSEGPEDQAPDQYWASLKVTWGIFVARSSDSDQGVPDMELVAFDPQATDNIMNPWVWRDSVILGNPASTFQSPFLPQTVYQPSLPPLDIKVKRNIRREHRLWMVCSAMGWDGGRGEVSSETNQPLINMDIDLRILGHMTRNKNTSSF